MVDPTRSFVLCIDNSQYPASLELRKIYHALEDSCAEKHGLLRVVDESGEDYLYPAQFFVAIEVPLAAKQAFSLAG